MDGQASSFWLQLQRLAFESFGRTLEEVMIVSRR